MKFPSSNTYYHSVNKKTIELIKGEVSAKIIIERYLDMKEKEFKKLQKEFNTTPFGRRSLLLSLAPFVFGLIFLLLFGQSIRDDNSVMGSIYTIGYIVSFVGGCISQLLYGILLKDYINKK